MWDISLCGIEKPLEGRNVSEFVYEFFPYFYRTEFLYAFKMLRAYMKNITLYAKNIARLLFSSIFLFSIKIVEY